jgi:hypothetical protein
MYGRTTLAETGSDTDDAYFMLTSFVQKHDPINAQTPETHHRLRLLRILQQVAATMEWLVFHLGLLE